jgi:hypothetical protein
MTRRSRAELLGQRLPLTAGAKPLQNARDNLAVVHARPATARLGLYSRKLPLHRAPQIIRNVVEVVAVHHDGGSQLDLFFTRF